MIAENVYSGKDNINLPLQLQCWTFEHPFLWSVLGKFLLSYWLSLSEVFWYQVGASPLVVAIVQPEKTKPNVSNAIGSSQTRNSAVWTQNEDLRRFEPYDDRRILDFPP